MLKFVIRAGGVGTRLWPCSRKKRPKQFQALAGESTMLQETYSRIAPMAGPADVFVSTGPDHVGLVREQLPALPEDHLIVEPALRNTGPAVALECALLEARWPGCTVASLGSDHYIGRPGKFRRLLSAAVSAAGEHPEYLYLLGVRPTRPETGFGYVGKGEELCRVGEETVWRVTEFTEKPGLERAREYTQSGRYLWNTNMFVWKARTVLGLFARHAPEIHERLQPIIEAAAPGPSVGWQAAVEREYPAMPSIAVDHAIIEPAAHVAALEGDLNWGDVGSWAALADVLEADGAGHLLSGRVLVIDGRNLIVRGAAEKLIALVGVEDLVVVDTEDALLVCRRDQAQRVREIVDRLGDDPDLERYL